MRRQPHSPSRGKTQTHQSSCPCLADFLLPSSPVTRIVNNLVYSLQNIKWEILKMKDYKISYHYHSLNKIIGERKKKKIPNKARKNKCIFATFFATSPLLMIAASFFCYLSHLPFVVSQHLAVQNSLSGRMTQAFLPEECALLMVLLVLLQFPVNFY